MTPAEFNQRVAVGAQLMVSDGESSEFARTLTVASATSGFIVCRTTIGEIFGWIVTDVTPLWFGEECDD